MIGWREANRGQYATIQLHPYCMFNVLFLRPCEVQRYIKLSKINIRKGILCSDFEILRFKTYQRYILLNEISLKNSIFVL